MEFTKEQVMWELRGMLLPGGGYMPLEQAHEISQQHDESANFWTVMCAADELYGKHVAA